MDRAGAVELLMPALTPISLWERTGRVESFGNVLIKFEVRAAEQAGARWPWARRTRKWSPTWSSRHVSSYRQLPITLYQIQTKFRNEERPRFGVLRTSEFMMKDAYSFDTSRRRAQRAATTRCTAPIAGSSIAAGLDYLAVEAESGPIGGDASHEFMVPQPQRRRPDRALPEAAATRPTWNAPKPAGAAGRRRPAPMRRPSSR